MQLFSNIMKDLKERYARFKGRKFYSRVRKVYTRSKEIKTNTYFKGGMDG